LQQPSQLTIRDLMAVTAIIAIWFAVFTISAHSAWLFLGVSVALCGASILRKVVILFFLPLIFSANWMLLVNCYRSWDPPTAALIGGFVVVFAIAVSEYTIRRTRDKFRMRANPSGASVFVQ